MRRLKDKFIGSRKEDGLLCARKYTYEEEPPQHSLLPWVMEFCFTNINIYLFIFLFIFFFGKYIDGAFFHLFILFIFRAFNMIPPCLKLFDDWVYIVGFCFFLLVYLKSFEMSPLSYIYIYILSTVNLSPISQEMDCRVKQFFYPLQQCREWSIILYCTVRDRTRSRNW